MLLASITINALLVLALAATIVRAKKKIRHEKIATFAGCLMAITSGLTHEDTRACEALYIGLLGSMILHASGKDGAVPLPWNVV